MKLAADLRRTIGVVFYTVGILLGVALAALSTWGDLEASLFDAAERAEKANVSLRCPIFIARGEVGEVSAAFTNTGQRPLERTAWAHISEGFVTLMREERVKLPLAPGETKRMSWLVSAEDAAYGFLILVRVSALRQAPMPSQSQACGILVLDLPGVSGALVTVLWLALSFSGMVGGLWLWLRAGHPFTQRRQGAAAAMVVLAALVAGALAAGLVGQWVVGVLLLALTALALIAILTHFVLTS
ncbi:MAG: hypothetical protein ACUVS6_11820 [Anaerolineae bacterium]